MRGLTLAVVVVAALAFATAAAAAYVPVYHHYRIQVVRHRRGGRSIVTSVTHSIETPRDAASGLPSGKRQH